MCTVSWWVDGCRRGVVFNRDEKRGRARGKPPEIFQGGGGAVVLGPVDPEAGGTWLGVNAGGLIAGVLNFYPHHQGEISGRRSRGCLLLDLLRSSSGTADVFTALGRPEALRPYRGFILFALDRRGPPSAAAWDGDALKRVPMDPVSGMLTTSSWEPGHCRRVREAIFAGLGPDEAALRRAHTVFDPREPGASPLMVREDAATDSITGIELGKEEARLHFAEVRGNPPIAGEPVHTRLSLEAAGLDR